MGRQNRIHVRDAVYHVFSQGNGGRDIFLSDDDRLAFLGILADVAMKTGARVLTYSLQGNHFHLLIRIGAVPLSAVMQRLLSRYARRFNAVNAEKGHLFRSRYKAKLCLDQAYLLNLFRYINMNAVKDGFVRRPEDWPWSSHNQLMGRIRSTVLSRDEALSLLNSDPTTARRIYARLVGSPAPDFTPEFDVEVEVPPEPADKRPSIEDIASDFCLDWEIDAKTLSGKSRAHSVSALRRKFFRHASASGFSNSEIAGYLGVSPSMATKYARD